MRGSDLGTPVMAVTARSIAMIFNDVFCRSSQYFSSTVTMRKREPYFLCWWSLSSTVSYTHLTLPTKA